MGWKGKLGIILLALVLSFFPACGQAPAPQVAIASGSTVSEISRQLLCQCGCNMVLLNCSHAECSSREAMTTLIKEKIAQGQSEAQIIQFFVAQYGEKVLAAPPKRGFNLTAWVTPFAALLLGGVVIYIALKRWVRRGRRPQAYVISEDDQEYEKYRRQLEEELEHFDTGGFR